MAPKLAASSSAPVKAAREIQHSGRASMEKDHDQDEGVGEIQIEYQGAMDMPFELREHCNICFEEGLHSQAISLLQNLLIANAPSYSLTSPAQQIEAVFRPPSIHLALAATLVVHPSNTTRASSSEQLIASDAAIRLLHTTNDILGPVNARFGIAFTFTDLRQSSRSTTRRKYNAAVEPASPALSAVSNDGDPQREDGQGGNGGLDIPMATTSSVFSRADDFWHLVGWAFNCSIRYPVRWSRWKLLLNFLLDTIEVDFAVRTAALANTASSGDSEAQQEKHKEGAGHGQTGVPSLTDTLLLRYCNAVEGRTGRRRIMRAVLADGSERSTREFREVFLNETVIKKKKNNDDDDNTEDAQVEKTKGKEDERGFDFEAGIYGDYDSSDDDLDNEKKRSTRLHRSATALKSEPAQSSSPSSDSNDSEEATTDTVKTAADDYGGMESVYMRQRILLLLAYLSAALPLPFTHLPDLFALYTEFLRPLPLRHFTLFLHTSLLPPVYLACLHQMLLRPLIAAAIPRDEIAEPTAADLCRWFLSHAAASANVADNAKVSVVLEGLVGGLLTRVAGENGGRDGEGGKGKMGVRVDFTGSFEGIRVGVDLGDDDGEMNSRSNNTAGGAKSSIRLTAKQKFVAVVREGVRRRAEKVGKKGDRRARKGTGGEEDWMVLERSAERLVVMAEALDV